VPNASGDVPVRIFAREFVGRNWRPDVVHHWRRLLGLWWAR
jgi:hypothetical protein